MRNLKIAFLLFSIATTGCAITTVVVEMKTEPPAGTEAIIKQLEGDTDNDNPSKCNLPCSITMEPDYRYQVSFDTPGYYPFVLEFDWLMAYNTSVVLKQDKSDGNRHTPLVIPLVPRE